MKYRASLIAREHLIVKCFHSQNHLTCITSNHKATALRDQSGKANFRNCYQTSKKKRENKLRSVWSDCLVVERNIERTIRSRSEWDNRNRVRIKLIFAGGNKIGSDYL